jgi:hypothetical protein
MFKPELVATWGPVMVYTNGSGWLETGPGNRNKGFSCRGPASGGLDMARSGGEISC